MESILITIKKMLGINEDDFSFDYELNGHINSALFILNQLGVGPTSGFYITGPSETWYDLLGDRKDLELVKTNVYLRVKLMFDPPQNSFLVASIQKQIEEFEWRIEVQHKTPVVEPIIDPSVE